MTAASEPARPAPTMARSVSRTFAAPPFLEGRPRGVPSQTHLIQVIHSGAAEGAIGDRKARRFDDMGRNAKACAEAQNRSGILRNVGLVKGKLHQASPLAEST